jgi:Formin Homology 2 Domain
MNSSSLRKILGLALHLGNLVHYHNGPSETVNAIELSSLMKLQESKVLDSSKTSFLEYVVRILRRYNPHVLAQYRIEFGATLGHLSTIQYQESITELENLQQTFLHLRNMAIQMGTTTQCSKSDDRPLELQENNIKNILKSTTVGQFVWNMTRPIQHVHGERDKTQMLFHQLAHFFGEIVPTSPSMSTTSGMNHEVVPALNDPTILTAVPQMLFHLSQFCSDLDLAMKREIETSKCATMKNSQRNTKAFLVANKI